MDPNDTESNQLPLEQTSPPPSESSPSVAATAEAATSGAPKGARKGGRTSARIAPKPGSRKKAGARPSRKPAPEEKAEVKRLPMMMQTSRVSDVAGKFVARRRVAMVAETRAEQLNLRGHARLATAAEIAAAGDQPLPHID